MIFQHTYEKVLAGEKTQTRRIVKRGDEINGNDPGYGVINCNRIRINAQYIVGRTYAVQPGRGKNAVGRIRLLDIQREDVRNISEADAIAEGFKDCREFMAVWQKMHDPKHQTIFGMQDRPTAFYDAWVLKFTLVEVYSG